MLLRHMHYACVWKCMGLHPSAYQTCSQTLGCGCTLNRRWQATDFSPIAVGSLYNQYQLSLLCMHELVRIHVLWSCVRLACATVHSKHGAVLIDSCVAWSAMHTKPERTNPRPPEKEGRLKSGLFSLLHFQLKLAEPFIRPYRI